MIECEADFYDGKKSEKKKIKLQFDKRNTLILVINQKKKKYPIDKVSLSPRIGKSPYKLSLPDGAICELVADSISDNFIYSTGILTPGKFIHKLESSFKYVTVFTVLTIIIAFGFVFYGLPFMTKHVSAITPVTSPKFGDDIVAVLDYSTFSDSNLTINEKEKSIKLLKNITDQVSYRREFQLVFRKGNEMGANALALPSGIIIVTDELIDLINNDHELEAILAHEVGHIVERHGIRQIIQGSVLLVLITFITGDISSVVTLASSIPIFLTETYYSREFEREADQYVLDYLTDNKISPSHFTNILERISPEEENFNFLSSHPTTDSRTKMFKSN